MTGSLRKGSAAVMVVAAALVIGACGSDEDGGGSNEASTPEPSVQQQKIETNTETGSKASMAGTTIATGDSQFGDVLFDGEDRAIYYFDKEKTSVSQCYGACAVAWPPVLTDGPPRAGAGAEDDLLGTTERNDGTSQVTYDGRPLYYYVDDPAGEVLCHNVEEFGGLWLAVQPDGRPVP
jgi:predicted lipoprotein with Yx(FWY)xxD motif